MKMKWLPTMMLVLGVIFLGMAGSLPLHAQASSSQGSASMVPLPPLAPVDFSNVLIIGVVEPTNRTGVPGHLSFPYMLDEMKDELGKSNYKIIPITPAMLQEQGINLYSTTTPDLDLTTKQIIDLGTTYHLDALMTGTLTYCSQRTEPQLFQLRRFWHVELAGTLYEVKNGNPVWRGNIIREERLDTAKDPGAEDAIKVQTDIDAVEDLADLFLKDAGTKPADTTAPVITINYPTSANKLRTEVIILLGNVTDATRVASLEFNGVVVDVYPKAEVAIYQPVYLPYTEGDKIATVTIKATDIFGNTATTQMGLERTAPLKGFVKRIDQDSVQVDIGTWNGVAKGMSFMLYNLVKSRDPVTGQATYNATPVDPVVVTNVYNKTCVLKLIHPEKISQIKLGDMVQ